MKFKLRHLALFVMLIAAITLTTGCAGKSVKLFYTKINATVIASSDLNPNSSGRPSPLVVRIYELKSVDTFKNSDFFTLYDDEAKALGDDLVLREEFELAPGEQKEIRRKLSADTQYVGIIAAFRDIDDARWQAHAEIKLDSVNTFTIEVGSHSVAINRR